MWYELFDIWNNGRVIYNVLSFVRYYNQYRVYNYKCTIDCLTLGIIRLRYGPKKHLKPSVHYCFPATCL